jgi:hypothetical protein
MSGKRLIGTLLATGLVCLAAAPAAGAVSAATAIANLHAQRRANGIPADVVNNSALSAGCAAHNNYMHSNGDALGQDEVPGRTGYTMAGDDAGNRAVLALGALPWARASDNPWETAPIHLAQLLDPSLAVSGYNESFRFSCAVTLADPRRAEPPAPRVYTYPGPGAHIYTAEQAVEGPFTPGQLVGLKQGTTTGPYIFVFVDGVVPLGPVKPDIVAATVKPRTKTGAKKARKGLRLKIVDSTNAQLGPYLPPGGVVIPVKPLKRGKYKASVTVSVAGSQLTKRWKFNAS